jgi:phosphoglycerate dehydrogenase-like enzyme
VSAPRLILVYHPEDAAAYAALVRLPRRGLEIAVCSTPEAAAARVGEAEILYAWGFPGDLLPGATRLRWIQCMGAGVERFLVPGLPEEVVITRAAGIFGPWMAEYALGWALWSTQKMERFRAQQCARHWRPVDPTRLHGATLCVVGLGEIGRAVARAAQALGMRVVGVSRSGRGAREAHRVVRPVALTRALEDADVVVVTVPLTAATRGLIGAAQLAAMKPTAWLINIARGPVVDESALLLALHERAIGGAVLDVFCEEPLPPGHPLWGLDNVVITPHISGPSTPAEIGPIFDDNLRRYLAGRPLRHVADRRRGY